MNILVINAGSSSLKCQYFVAQKSIASLLIERIGEKQSEATLLYGQTEHKAAQHLANHHEAFSLLVELFRKEHILEDFHTLNAVGHRVVHGGEHFSQPIKITPDVIATIERVIPLAPLHNPSNLEAIRTFAAHYPSIPQIAVFDTAFHQSIPPHAYHYAIPLELKEKYAIRRYGFHGTSHSYVAKEGAKLLGKPLEALRLITLHLGNGASAAAIAYGKSVDTSMGMTPLEGLMMGTRSGDIDPAIIPYLVRNGFEVDTIDTILNKKSGLKGICGTNDMRDIIARADKKDENARLALFMYTYRIKKYIGAYAAAMGGVDAVIFTGGIGEHAVRVRKMVCDAMAWMGMEMDSSANEKAVKSGSIVSTPASSVTLLVIPTNEELEIVRQSERVLDKE